MTRLLASFLLVCALAGTGFAHRPGAQPPAPELLAFLQAGGALSDLCGAPAEAPHGATVPCEACLLVSAALVPLQPPDLDAPRASLATAGLVPGTAPHVAAYRNPSCPVRAPPSAGADLQANPMTGA